MLAEAVGGPPPPPPPFQPGSVESDGRSKGWGKDGLGKRRGSAPGITTRGRVGGSRARERPKVSSECFLEDVDHGDRSWPARSAGVRPEKCVPCSELGDIPCLRRRFWVHTIRPIASGPRTSVARPKSAPEELSIDQLRVVSPRVRAQIRWIEHRAGRGRSTESTSFREPRRATPCTLQNHARTRRGKVRAARSPGCRVLC